MSILGLRATTSRKIAEQKRAQIRQERDRALKHQADILNSLMQDFENEYDRETEEMMRKHPADAIGISESRSSTYARNNARQERAETRGKTPYTSEYYYDQYEAAVDYDNDIDALPNDWNCSEV